MASNPPQSETLVISLDVGTSSVRTLLFNAAGEQQPGFGKQIAYEIASTPDGGVEVQPAELLALTTDCLAAIHEQMRTAGLAPAAVGFCAFWHSFLGVNRDGNPATPILHLFDTRSAQQVGELERLLDARQVHAATGCRLHTSYWPAKLLWLRENRAAEFAASERWMSFGEYLFLKLFGAATASTSMASGSGLWNQAGNDYDDVVLGALPINRSQLCPPGEMDLAHAALLEPYRSQWPVFQGARWFPALGDGACNNIGSGCLTADAFSLMVGTSGAMRAVVAADRVRIPDGLWCYRVDRARYVLGGALSNGGEVYAWIRRTLALPEPEEAERELLASRPGSHGLLLLPFFAGERSPYWRPDLRAAITGLGLATRPIEILQAALESVALRFGEIFALMSDSLGPPRTIVASGGALLKSPAWTQMMSDALGLPVLACLEPEATARGAALLALERMGILKSVADAGVCAGALHRPRPEYCEIYAGLLARQKHLYQRLFTEN